MSDPIPWSVDGEKLKADPTTMEGFGKNAAIIGKNFQADISGPVMLIRGSGEDIAISRGGFPEGTKCQGLLERNSAEMFQFLGDAYKNVLAIASCTLVLADLLKTTDLKGAAMTNAVEWALVMPGARKPDGLPSYIDGSTLNDQEKEKTPIEATFANPEAEKLVSSHVAGNLSYSTYLTPAGTIRSVIRNVDGSYTEIGYRKDGKTMVFKTTGDSDGNATTISYAKNGETVDGKVSRTTVNTTPSVTGGIYYKDETVKRYNGDGELTSSETTHTKTTSQDKGTATRDSYTETTIDGKTTISDVQHVTKQPDAVDAEDYLKFTGEREQEIAKQYGKG
jgi:hypothetical protein